ncbi:P-loop NTPase fold protein [Streptomyces sp. NBC_01808]|uniref:P-loop NTPase fold protein n=1 Tax=Streptomyces sp. NBC_01808 TaxID=2975947 RepID=UPI002DD884DC|nr:P-loop NTPase fold protein [Streptomyces sp. NBC_01808]WSA40130.1 P-loop NTPase fold protein [Streptomyces sp. NBC_01808]
MAAQPPTGTPTFASLGAGTLALVNDEPVAAPGDDILGTGLAAAQLARLLHASRASTPFTLAVDAGWGMGKSSLMRLVDARLRAEPDVETVWYNAWTSTGADALEGLVKSVLVRFERRTLKRALARISRARTVTRGVRAVTTVLGGALGAAGLVDELWTSWDAGPEARNGMREEIDRMAREWAGNRPQRLLVVFIDDLDRCSEETVLAVCEALKIYLDVPGLVFVVGCDRSALGPSGLLRDLSPAGSAFMEKIFQTSYRIPVADNDGVGRYVEWCARTAGIEGMLDEVLKKLLVERSGRNPRRIKRLVNGFVLEATLNPVWSGFRPEAVIRTLLLQYFYPEFYRMMTGASGAPGGDVVQEFTTYRRVRRTLLSPVPPEAQVSSPEFASAEEVGAFFEQYELSAPETRGEAEHGLEQMERRLPVGFPEHADDQGFTSLLGELLRVPDAERLLVLLREGAPVAVEGTGQAQPPVALPYVDERGMVSGTWGTSWGGGQYEAPYGHQAPYPEPALAAPSQQAYPPPAQGRPPQAYPPPGQVQPQPAYPTPVPPMGDIDLGRPLPSSLALEGLRILWVDDHPENNAAHVRRLRGLGARISIARDREEGEQELAAFPFDLLISDITRGGEQSAGLDDLRAWRTSGTYDGRAVFLSSRVTPEREEVAAGLDARIFNSGDALLGYVMELAVSLSAVRAPAPSAPEPSAPAPRPSDAPPG